MIRAQTSTGAAQPKADLDPGPRPKLRRVDAVLGAILFAWFAYSGARIAFDRPEWADWIAYALPAANLVERGALSTPQYGPYARFDRDWLFNSPLMGLGPAPFYRALYVGRVPYLLGVAAGHVLNLAVVASIVHRTVAGRSWAAAVFGSQAILSHRYYLGFLYNQRYDIYTVAIVAAAFAPTRAASGRVPARRWLFAGLLLLAHPAMAPAAALWLAGALLDATTRTAGRRRRGTGRVGPALFVAAGLLALAWYGRPEALRAQFLPYLESMAHRSAGGGGLTLLDVAAGFPYRIASQATALTIALASVYLSAVPSGRGPAEAPDDRRLARLPALGIALPSAADCFRRFPYLNHYALGLGPALLYLLDTPRRRRVGLVVVLALAAANVAVGLRIDRQSLYRAPSLADQAEAIAMVVAKTRPGDRIVLAPPFVLASAPRVLPGGRHVVGVLPQVWYLEEFDAPAHRERLRRSADVYVGDPTWFEFAYYFDMVRHERGDASESRPTPLFVSAATERAAFGGDDVIIARKLHPVPASQKAGAP